MNKRIRALAVALAILAVGAYAKDKPSTPIKPKRDEVVFIVKVRTQPSLPVDFLRGYVKESKRGEQPTTAYAALYSKNSFFGYLGHEIGALNEFGYFAVKPNKERTFAFPAIKILALNVSDLSIMVPLNTELTVPEGVTHVYLGSFVFRYSDVYFTPSEIVRLDEFDEVKAELTAAFGDDFNLIRAPLKEASLE
ncbi:MAG: hypothetical protein CVV47_15800 [Spirochaetae bacterium HGW-Spirochaetae-3]|jgi:hypothetical protein|nr:MAG: hypothetical protein CVV47_15800 [Spirochaetae bacterium HGW-Spirochaetae-3]